MNALKASGLLLMLAFCGTAHAQNQVVIVTAITPVPLATLSNVSCRAAVGVDGGVAIAGFVVTGQPGSLIQVLVRGVGPTLGKFSVPSALAQPQLAVFDSTNKQLATNTGWSSGPTATGIAAATVSTGAFALPQDSADCALLLTLSPGSYTAVVSSGDKTVGTALVEVYGVPGATLPSGPAGVPPVTTSGSGSG
ncbi:MAG TPA: hypothetical protein VFE25_09060 [Opitutaceae bacterium]|nr:hypothetical protein [Opitutaceae bacterium]